MSRIIKFRAWLNEWDETAPVKGKMFYDVIPMGGWDEWWIAFDGHDQGYDGAWKPGEGIEVMQFTGLTDRKGKEIYEGDVVGIDGANAEVCYYAGSPMVKNYFVNHPHSYLSQFDESDVEVIGNIYENPDLLTS